MPTKTKVLACDREAVITKRYLIEKGYVDIASLKKLLGQVRERVNRTAGRTVVASMYLSGSLLYLQRNGQVPASLLKDIDIVVITADGLGTRGVRNRVREAFRSACQEQGIESGAAARLSKERLQELGPAFKRLGIALSSIDASDDVYLVDKHHNKLEIEFDIYSSEPEWLDSFAGRFENFELNDYHISIMMIPMESELKGDFKTESARLFIKKYLETEALIGDKAIYASFLTRFLNSTAKDYIVIKQEIIAAGRPKALAKIAQREDLPPLLKQRVEELQ